MNKTREFNRMVRTKYAEAGPGNFKAFMHQRMFQVRYYNDKRKNGRRKIFKTFNDQAGVAEAFWKKMAQETGWTFWMVDTTGHPYSRGVGMCKHE